MPPTETWTCGDCDQEATAPVGDLAGDTQDVVVGTGRYETRATTAVCPNCGSEDWHSESTRDTITTPS
jgi:hypothetical protein